MAVIQICINRGHNSNKHQGLPHSAESNCISLLHIPDHLLYQQNISRAMDMRDTYTATFVSLLQPFGADSPSKIMLY